MQFVLYFFFTFLCKRNRECIKYKNCVCFHCLSPYSKDSREMQGEQILRGLQCLFWPARAKLIIFAADSVLTFHVSSPHPLNKRSSTLRLCLFHCLPFSILSHDFECRRTCSYCYLCAPFLPFYTFSHLCISFFSFLLFLPFFSSYFSFIPIFTRTSFIALNFILLRASLDATISLSVSVFIRLNPRATSGLLQLIYLLTSPE